MSEAHPWRWLDAGGATRTLSSEQLRAALRDGTIPPDARVAREGSDGWVAAADAVQQDQDIPPPPASAWAAQRELEGPSSEAPTAPRHISLASQKRTVVGMPVPRGETPASSLPPPRSHKPTLLGVPLPSVEADAEDLEVQPPIPPAPPPARVSVPSAPRVGGAGTTAPMAGRTAPKAPMPVATKGASPAAPRVQVPLPGAPAAPVPPGKGKTAGIDPPKPATPSPAPAPAGKGKTVGIDAPPETPAIPVGPHGTRVMQPFRPSSMPPPASTEARPPTEQASLHSIASQLEPAADVPTMHSHPSTAPAAPAAPAASEALADAPIPATPMSKAFSEPPPPQLAPMTPAPPEAHAPPFQPPAHIATPPLPMHADAIAPPPSAQSVDHHVPSIPPAAPPGGWQDRSSEPEPDLAPARPRRAMLPVVLGVMGVFVLIGLVAGVMALLRKPSAAPGEPTPTATTASAATTAPSPTSSASKPPAPAATDGVAPCTLAKTAVKLSPRASKDVPLEMAGIPATGRVLVGFSADGKSPQGIDVDPATLAVKRVVVPRGVGKLHRVLPVPLGTTARWLVDAEVPKALLAQTHSVATDPPYVIGLSGGTLSAADRVIDPPRTLWPVPSGRLDVLRVLVVPGDGPMVAIRSGDAVLVGLLATDRTPRGDLVQVSEAGQVGTPTLGTNGVEIAVAFAYRASASAPWSLRVAHGPHGVALGKAAAFAVPEGGPGGDAFAPALAGMADGRWILAWTEGTSGARVVRAVTLSSSFAPVGAPVVISPAEASGGQPTLAVSGDSALAVYLTSAKKGGYEVWGTTLACR